MISAVDPTLPMRARRSEMWTDVSSRKAMAQMLILDTSGKLEAMNSMGGYSDDAGIEFTDEIKAAAEDLTRGP